MMSRMVLSKRNSPAGKLFDAVRGQLVEKTPEEVVRQRLLNYMSKECGFPKSLIAVEKSLKELPHLQHTPNACERRIDVLCFARHIHPAHTLYPLVLAECKAGHLTAQAVEQALGYNAQIGAAFVLLVNPTELRLYCPSSLRSEDPKGNPAGSKELTFLPSLLHYSELVQLAKRLYAQ